MTTAFYRTGTVAVTQNSKVVTGTGTNWTTGPIKPLAGDVFIFNNKMYEIDSVVSDTEIRLYRNFEDSTASSKSYAIMRNASLNISARIAAQVAQVVNQKQIMIDEFHDFLTNNTDSTVPLTDTLGNVINVMPIPALSEHSETAIANVESASTAAIDLALADFNDKSNVLTAAASSAVEAISGSKLVLVLDDFGVTHLVRRFPVFTYEDLGIAGCPFTGVMDAFKRQDGSIRPYIDVAVHEMSNINGRAASASGLPPWTYINTDTTRAKCQELRPDAIMVGRYVDAMLGWLMIASGFQPRGNTEYGRSHSNNNEFGQRADGLVPNDRSGAAVVLTGTGPDAWRHDGTAFGVSNWVGNVWERDEGWKLVDSEIHVSEYMGQPEAEWVATGRHINIGHRFSMAKETTGSSSQEWGLFTKDADYIEHELLQRLLIEPIDCTKVLQGRFYYNVDGERFPLRGGSWGYAAFAGPAAVLCNNERSNAGSSIGGRFAFAS